MTEPTNRRNIALTGKAELAKDAIMARFPFSEGQQVARLGLAYAINKHLAAERAADFGRAGDGQNMAVAGFDPTHEIRALLQALYPDAEDPYVVAETLMSVGLVTLHEDLESGAVTRLSDIAYGENSPIG